MKSVPFLVSTIASGLCLILGIWLFVVSSSNQGLQNDLQKLQEEMQNQQQLVQGKQQQYQKQQGVISEGNAISQQVGPALLRDMATLSTKNEKMKSLLAKHGYNVEVKAPEDGVTPAATPKP